jgi:hypothetical protein
MASKKYVWTSSSGDIELSLTRNEVMHVPPTGPADEGLFNLAHMPSITAQTWTISDASLFNALKEYGSWSDDELSCRVDNIMCILWIACCDLHETIRR